MGFDVTCNEFIAVQHLLPRCPLGGLNHEAAEAAAFLVQTLDVRNQIIRCADTPGPVFDHFINDFVSRTVDLKESQGVFKVFALIVPRPDARLLKGRLRWPES